MASLTRQESEDGYSSITGGTLQKAIKELNENPVTRGSIVKELRDRICAKEKELEVSRIFLFVCVCIYTKTFRILEEELTLKEKMENFC